MGCSHIYYTKERWQGQLGFQSKCKTYPLQHNTDVLNKYNGYAFFSKLAISMQYNT